MALTGLEIFKLLPKTNCKKCGRPTCLAFAMSLAQKKAGLDECPDVSEQAKEVLAASASPPMRKIVFGAGAGQVQTGQETVSFRHEEKFHNPTVLAVSVSDKLSQADLKQRIDSIKSLRFERVGTSIAVRAVAVINDSGRTDAFVRAVKQVKESCDLALIILTQSPDTLAAAAKLVKGNIPLLGQAGPDTAQQMSRIAKENGCPLVVRADSLEALAGLSEKIKADGFEDIVLCPPSSNSGKMRDLLYELSCIRTLALKKGFRPLGYPAISFACGTSDDDQLASAVSLICKYSGIVVVDTVGQHALLPMLTTVMNIFTDPQKPVQVEPRIYSIGQPDENSPLMFTTNFSLTYYTVESDIEASRISSYVLVVDTEGTSVLTAYSGDKLSEKTIADAMTKQNVEKLVRHRKLIIPGYVAVLSGKIEEATNWQVLVGPRESSMIPKYLREVWT
jgi:acetyl-CoA decarbonylase/synthase complex subunit gamma